MDIRYKINHPVSVAEFIDLEHRSLYEHPREVDIPKWMEKPISSNLVITAWDKNKLIGIARSITDHKQACYLSCLAVDKKYQKNGIEGNLHSITQGQLSLECKLVLAPALAVHLQYK